MNPVEIVDLDTENNRETSSKYSGPPHRDLVQVGEGKQRLPVKCRFYSEKFRNFELRPSDVIIAGFPRSGTSLTETMVWHLVNNLNFEKASQVPLEKKVPFFEAPMVLQNPLPGCEGLMNSFEILEGMSTNQRRVFKTHLYFDLLPPNLLTLGCKVIYIARHPKDVAVSSYHFMKHRSDQNSAEDFPTFFELFRNDLIIFTPYWAHIKQGWTRRDSPNLLCVFYEDFKKDSKKYIRDISNFIGKRVNEKEVDLLAEHLDFDTFKKETAKTYHVVNKDPDSDFIRKGKVGGWKDYFTPEMNAKADPWIAENVREIGITYPFEL